MLTSIVFIDINFEISSILCSYLYMTARPPSMEMPDADISSQAIKRRMPPEIKLKLAKVARLAVLRIANLILLFLPVIFTE